VPSVNGARMIGAKYCFPVGYAAVAGILAEVKSVVQDHVAGISKALSALEGEPLARVRKWLDESYNKADEIEAIIAAEKDQVIARRCEERVRNSYSYLHPRMRSPHRRDLQYPALVLEACETWKAQELMEIAHSCNPHVRMHATTCSRARRNIVSHFVQYPRPPPPPTRHSLGPPTRFSTDRRLPNCQHSPR
jgi:hypothetical protein